MTTVPKMKTKMLCQPVPIGLFPTPISHSGILTNTHNNNYERTHNYVFQQKSDTKYEGIARVTRNSVHTVYWSTYDGRLNGDNVWKTMRIFNLCRSQIPHFHAYRPTDDVEIVNLTPSTYPAEIWRLSLTQYSGFLTWVPRRCHITPPGLTADLSVLFSEKTEWQCNNGTLIYSDLSVQVKRISAHSLVHKVLLFHTFLFNVIW